jgi:predicted RNase H-like HicB family nuclease
MAEREFTVVVEADEDGYLVVSVPELPGCHTQARTLDELMERVKEAILLCLDDGLEPPSGRLVGIHHIAV